MFLEPEIDSQARLYGNIGWIEVICGSMFSGKTEELIRRVKRALIAKQEVKIFKPALDTRYDHIRVVSHNKNSIVCQPVEKSTDILSQVKNVKIIAIDEIQFFDDQIIQVCNLLANKGCRVIVSGLDMDFRGVPFSVMPALVCMAEFVTKVHAICVRCGSIANYSHRLSDEAETVLLGETEKYEPLCRACFTKINQSISEPLEQK